MRRWLSRLMWGGIYVLVFALSAGGGALMATRTGQSFAGIEEVDWDDTMGSVETDLPYGDGELNCFDLFLPADAAHASRLVLYIHAGGFTSGDKADDTSIAESFAAQGYVAATINYSLASEGSTASVPEMAQEIRAGVAAIEAAASERGYDLDGIVLAGGSAGGALAMITAYGATDDLALPVDAVMSFVGPAGFEPADWFDIEDRDYATDESAEAGAAFASIMAGQRITPEMMRSGAYREVLAPITAKDLVHDGAPPSLLAYGALDKVAPYAASREMEGILEAHGVPHDVLVFPNSGHALNRDPEMNEELGGLIQRYLDTYAPLRS
ncbi:alpha/beta hydrolase [Brachybacterium sp. NBEC-018]|uniref:alpha/beta hydrolase n=1 Tax=Brachybacterium sp. NBEC-018 TaxID=2996004 RepID=UPI002174F062|nr:alpha/beta hydrolase [Brachybacterium sp. NBEC-018]UVY82621.1 alpha/beta hydrolase [Brachybacterium sp. NBEC-018]